MIEKFKKICEERGWEFCGNFNVGITQYFIINVNDIKYIIQFDGIRVDSWRYYSQFISLENIYL